MQRTQFMGQDERYSDTSVVAQKVSDTSISRDEFEVFLCTICDWKDPNKEAGDFGDPAGLGQYNEEFRNKEPNIARLTCLYISLVKHFSHLP